MSKLHEAVKTALELPENTLISVKDLDYSDKLFLITLDLKNQETEQVEQVQISLTDNGEGKYQIKKLPQLGAFVFGEKAWIISEPKASEEAKDLGIELQVTGKVLKPNLKNINLAMIAQIDPMSKLVEEMREIEKLMHDEDLISKIFMAMGAWVRFNSDNNVVTVASINQMITDSKHEGELSDEGKRNPIKKCWNDQVP